MDIATLLLIFSELRLYLAFVIYPLPPISRPAKSMQNQNQDLVCKTKTKIDLVLVLL